MKTISRIALALVALVTLAITSCNDDKEQDVFTQQKIQNCYAAVTDLNTNTTNYISQMTLSLGLNWTTLEADIIISGLKTDATLPHITLDVVKWNADGNKGWCKASATTVGGNAAGYRTFTITDFELRWIDRLGLGAALGYPLAYFPGCEFSFVIDGRWRVVGGYAPYLLFGKTESTGPGGMGYTTEATYYSVQPDFSKMTATIAIAKAQFLDRMPPMNIQFTDVPMTVDSDGDITLSAQALIPQLDDKTPQENYPISDLYAEIDPGEGMTLTFKCNVKKAMLFTVNADVNYTDYSGIKD